tara:strand:- start:182 stop:511 length:330 start_codon:yes stop_codon:yes gene_type:complete
MTDNTKELDIAQRIAEHLARTSEPKASASGSKKKGGEVIGSVPVHLRHLHNLLDELGDEVVAAEREFLTKKERMMMVRSIFFDALMTQVPESKNCSGVTVLENWDVVAN